ncbi:MAG: bifunctional UDP-N-acetylglucosamine diphosphorylase/glucosamine-1-phosphate N-acetyltransferase GlmU, partial [Jatrophihabitans sp.]
MRSAALPKVLHGFAGRSLLGHVLAASDPLGARLTAVVVGHRREEVTAHLAAIAPDAVAVVQAQQHGTGHAVRLALEAVPDTAGAVLVLPGDTPLLTVGTLARLVAAHGATGAAATVLTAVVPDPTGYGRVLRDDAGRVTRIVEHKEASEAERAVDEVASGVYVFDGTLLREVVGRLSRDNAQGEEYLPDVVAALVARGARVEAL